ncbi:TonB-dependent receptor [Pseudoxanthomonas jiangsuensis]|uniref:TonB-dependent receptor n=1 Tax=Pseudoxanthomonas jiangsuensis TaxID=619688 RepID=UPI00139158F2|nr:TonB-dependent receptor [Pseudoxanthomonas jiangsuensis]KAF1692952.1 TonB-dependent receptor [Pseudoxanthomonas jiangsuensis]
MSKHHYRSPANRISAPAANARHRRSLLALSVAMLLAAPSALAQQADTEGEVTELDQVQVTGIRGSVYRAQDIKRDADTFVDSVTALDIGALPDRSVTETLSRIPGVTIDRFLSVGDPEHFSAEGNGVAVRGLTQVRSELNGRDSFSASGGRSLSFGDVPSELMAGVDVYKNQKADMIEGGLGGTVDLRTFMPFDFEGRKIGASFSVNRGDFAEQVKPSASLLFSNRWDTDAGDFGILVDLAHSELATRTDGMFVRPFFNNANSDLNGDGTNEALWLPRGADWRTLDYERERQGAYVAMQWRPNDRVEVFATGFQSTYDELWYEDAIFLDNDPLQVRLDASQPYQLDGDVFVSGRLASGGNIPMGADIRASHRDSKTQDFSAGLKWLVGDNTELSTEVQYIKATTKALDSTVTLGLNVPYIDVDLSGGRPVIGVDESFTANIDNYYWAFTMDHQDDNEAEEIAWRADLKHSFDSGFVESLKFGVRMTDRDAHSIDTGYDWQPVIQPWMQWWALPGDQPLPGVNLNGQVNSSLTNLTTFENFYRGDAKTPGAIYAPILSTALGFPVSYQDIHSAADPYYLCCYAGVYAPRDTSDEQWSNIQKEKTYAAYAMLNFAVDSMRMDGNVGVRVVRTENSADGYLIFPNVAYAPYLGAGESTPVTAENSYTDVLPSANLKWELADNLVMRFAASKAIARPNFSDMQAYQQLNAGTKPGIDPPDDGSSLSVDNLDLTGSSYDNPYLEPMKANQFDLSLEWYFAPDRGGMAWINVFHKDVKDYFRRQTELVSYPGADGNSYDYLITRPVNVGTARIQGAEIGWNQFFDFLPAPFDGLGMSANYTFIDSSTKVPGNIDVSPVDTDGSTFGDLPADGLSKNAYNVAAFYEKGPWQVRLAYNWRSEYLLSVGPNGYNGTHNDIAWKLPVYSDEFGQLDGSIFYRFSDNVQFGLEMNNLNNAEQRTIMDQNGAGRRVTSWYVNDRRYAATLRFTF